MPLLWPLLPSIKVAAPPINTRLKPVKHLRVSLVDECLLLSSHFPACAQCAAACSARVHPTGGPALKPCTCVEKVTILVLTFFGWLFPAELCPPPDRQRWHNGSFVLLLDRCDLTSRVPRSNTAPLHPGRLLGAPSERPVIKSMVNALNQESSETLSGIRLRYW